MTIEKKRSFKKTVRSKSARKNKGGCGMKKIKILAVDDEKNFLHIYESFFSHDEMFEISLAESIEKGREFIKKEKYDIVLMDANFGINGPTGIKEAIRLKRKYPKMIVAIVSGYGGLIQEAQNVDICIGKPIADMESFKEVLMSLVIGKLQEIDETGIKLLNVRVGDFYEGFEGETIDGLKIRWTAYTLPEHPKKFFTIGVSASKGCDGRCFNCLSQENGLVRELEKKEIISQVFHGLNGFLGFRAYHELTKGKKIKFGINSTCGGDWMNVPNPQKTLDAFLELKKIYKFQPEFILTSVGKIKTLEWLTENLEGMKYLRALKPELYFSLNYPFQEEREKRMKGTKGEDIKTLLNLHHQVSLITKERNTVSYVLAKGINDSKEHAFRLAELLKGYENSLSLKLQKAENIKKIKPSNADMLNFQGLVLEKNQDVHCRIRRIV
jgi:adenine C2-methylase RlmN of 23S rRNA A2503 and tRNA A37/ActR/RegA family two-component response regulator